MIAANLGKLGITVKLEPLPWRAFLKKVQGGKHQLCLLGWTTDNGDADNFLSTFFDSENTELGSALNVSFFKNATMDRLLTEQRRAIEPKQRRRVLGMIYRHLRTLSPMVPLVTVRDVFAHHPLLEGVTVGPIHHRALWRIRIRKK